MLQSDALRAALGALAATQGLSFSAGELLADVR
jgi:hypothetical protein